MPESLQKVLRNGVSILIALFCTLFLSFHSATAAPNTDEGKKLFNSNCASCHNPLRDATGPALQNVDKHPHGRPWIYNWVHNPPAILASGDPHANELYAKFKAQMTAFPQLTNKDIDAILDYVDAYTAPVTATTPAGGGTTTGEESDSDAWMYTLATFALLLIVLILWRVNSGLKRVAARSVGEPVEREIPIYRNKLAIAITVILVMIFAGYWIVNGAINTGRMQNYKPRQPIFYSHKVHAGTNQINCLYCHAGAEKSKHAMVPSTNICMNCHKQINEYTGEKDNPLYDAEGHKVNGTQEIKKLYAAAGWNEDKKDYNRDAKGNIITGTGANKWEWVKIHNLPDHVYFNHSQHVKVGQIQCQRCHGPIETMDEVYQFAPLSMGWCINCHRQTQVKFTENNYYSIFKQYHKEMKAGTREGVTVEDIGGIECQKCHY